MSAKLLHALSDDNPDLQKQIGCMTGIFQLFDRHSILTPKRIASYSNQKRLPSGHSHFSNNNHDGEYNNACHMHTTKEKSQSKNLNENQRVSIDSSRVSFSTSSCSSSFSSVDCNKPNQPEPSSFDRAIALETSVRESSANQANTYAELGRSPDLRDVVKDSIYKEHRGLSVKTTTREEPTSRVMKHRDSPRPLQLSKSLNGSYELGSNMMQRMPTDLKDSLRVLTKLQEAPQYFNDTRERPRSSYEGRDGTSFPVQREARRFSYDGRERARSSFESQDTFKSATKFRELPRLSLDSRASNMRGSDPDTKSNSVLKEFHRGSGNSGRSSSPKQEGLDSQKKNPSVVAKLMGLEAMPTRGQMEDHDSFSRPCVSTLECKHNSVSSSPRSSLKEISPRLRNPDPLMKPVSNSRFPIEPASWRQMDGGHGIQKPMSRSRESPPRGANASPSVYAEVEKRLKELEFKQADKDLRALKQILDAMQAKGFLEAKKEEDRGLLSERNYDHSNQLNLDQNPRPVNRRTPLSSHPISANIKQTSSAKAYESPIVIMKPAKLVEKSGIHASSVIRMDGISGLRKVKNGNSMDSKKGSVNSRMAKDLASKLSLREPTERPLSSADKKVSVRNLRSAQTSTKSQNLSRESTVGFGRSSGSVSPRLQHKKLELEKRSRPPIPSSDSSKPRRQSVRQPTESGSPGGKRRVKLANVQQTDDQHSEFSSETRNLSHQGDEVSQRSDSNISFTSQIDIEVTSTDRSGEANCGLFHQDSQSPSRKAASHLISNLKQKKLSPRMREESPPAELITIGPEQPSPVSVLDSAFYNDDLVSPERKISAPFKDDEARRPDDSPSKVDPHHLSDSNRSKLSSGINRKKLENVEQLVQKLRRLNSNHDEATTDYIASLCENTNPDHRYVSEILLASGLLLRDLGSGLNTVQLHQSGYPINPDLFVVLEQTKGSNTLSKDKHSSEEKAHRKLVFDSVNEILERKLASICPELSLHSNKLAGKTLNGQQLLKELCSEIEQLQKSENLESKLDDDDSLKCILLKDVTSPSENWVDFGGEVSGMVLDIERLIFKDLVAEVVSGETTILRSKSSRRCRQLFSK